jgi:hypothetical protein
MKSHAPLLPRTTAETAIAHGNSHFQEVLVVRDFMRDKVRPVLLRTVTQDNDTDTVFGLFLRAIGWFATFAKLGHPQHLQAALAGTRALLEICIDLTLLNYDRQNLTTAMIVAWERSTRLQAAERTKRCFAGRKVPELYEPKVLFVDREGPAIRAERARVWPGRKKPERHPDRWTGRSLEQDVEAADALGGYGFKDYYDAQYAELCWGTHGSGLAGVRFVPREAYPWLIAQAFKDSAEFGALASELSLRYYDKFDAIVQARFQELTQDRKRGRAVGFVSAKTDVAP